jgi:NADH dehydrogenase FAD-containing subunit
MPKHLVLAGAGHAHITLLIRLGEITGQGHKVTVVGPAQRHYYSGMGPGMLGGSYRPEDISFPVKQMTEDGGGTFVQDYVTGVEPEARRLLLKSGEALEYDVISFNTGSSIPDDIVDPDDEVVYRVKPIENLWKARQRLLDLARSRPVSIGVVGGSHGALEIAGNAWAAGNQNGGKGCEITVYAGHKFLRRTHPQVERIARRVFAQRGIRILEGQHAVHITGGAVTLEDGQEFSHDLIFLTTGVKPRPFFEPAGIPAGADGGLKVNRFLQNDKHPEIFGGGDCIWFEERPLDKVGVYAVRQNPVLFNNVLAYIEGRELQPFDPGGPYLLIFNLGGGFGIFIKWNLVFSGKMAFRLKNYIDTSFIRKFSPEK